MGLKEKNMKIKLNKERIFKHLSVSILGIYTLYLSISCSLHFMILSNLAYSEGDRNSIVHFLSHTTTLGMVTYAVLLLFFILKPRHRLCHYYLAVYAIYTGFLSGYISWGNFINRISKFGFKEDVFDNMRDIFDFIVPLAFAILLVTSEVKSLKERR